MSNHSVDLFFTAQTLNPKVQVANLHVTASDVEYTLAQLSGILQSKGFDCSESPAKKAKV